MRHHDPDPGVPKGRDRREEGKDDRVHEHQLGRHVVQDVGGEMPEVLGGQENHQPELAA